MTRTTVLTFVCWCMLGRVVVMATTPIDHHATPRTRTLLNLLHALSRDHHKVLFGQHAATQVGVFGGHAPYNLGADTHDGHTHPWQYSNAMARSEQPGELCDMCSVVNDFPAIFSMDLNNLDQGNVDRLTELVKQANRKGAVLTVSWHHVNPVSGGGVYISDDHGDVQHTVRRLLPGGDHHHALQADLDVVASWAKSLQDDQGRLLPIIFRPYHEASGSWFWWGQHNNAHNSASDIVQLYQTTVKYLRDDRGVHNFLYAFSPDCNYNWTANSLYPGDHYVDVVGVDCYMASSMEPMKAAVLGAVSHALQAGKAAAWTEFGKRNGLEQAHHNFFTHDILRTMVNNDRMMGVAYMVTWANRCSSPTSCVAFAPYPGHPLASDFKQFYNDSHTMFLSDLHRYAPYFSD